nr:sulfatase-like hydrolase/transferase [Oceanipulchritudo coccoides]
MLRSYSKFPRDGRLQQLVCLLCGLLGLTNAIVADRAGESLPNVIFFFADDIGWADVGRYHEHYADGVNQPSVAPVPTPNMNRLCDEGMIFTDAQLPAALCAPNRFCVMTGNYTHRSRPWGTWDRDSNTAFHYGDAVDDRIDNPHRTVGTILQEAGYRTAFFGKMHFGGDFFDSAGAIIRPSNADLDQIDYTRQFRNGLLDHGFDYTFATPDGIQGPVYAYFENDLYRPISSFAYDIDGVDVSGYSILQHFLDGDLVGNGEMIQDGYGDSEFDTSEHGVILSHFAAEFIADHEANHVDKPFLVYYAAPAIHVPHTPSSSGIEAAGATGLGSRADFIYDLDQQLGRLLDKLEALGIADNTLIIVSSDNGGYPGINGNGGDGMVDAGQWPNGPFRGNKGSVYEGGHRVPFIWKWGDGTEPGSVIPPGKSSDQLVSVIDWVASMVDLTGGALPDDQNYDSASLLPLVFSGQPDLEAPVRTIHHYFFHNNNQRAVRMNDAEGKWFLKRTSPIELYDLATDLDQSDNLIEGFSSFGDIPESHPHKARIDAMNAWYNAHNNSYSPRSTPSADFSDEATKTPIPVPVPAARLKVEPNLLFSAENLTDFAAYDIDTSTDLQGSWSLLETIPELATNWSMTWDSALPIFFRIRYPEKADRSFLPLR